MVMVLNSQASTDYVLEGLEACASSDSWAGNWSGPQPCGPDPARRAHRGRGPSLSLRHDSALRPLPGTRAGWRLLVVFWG